MFELERRRIYIAGHTGLVGSALIRRLQRKPVEVLTAPHAELDLREQAATQAFVAGQKPDIVVVAAASVGGILANSSRPADFIYDQIQAPDREQPVLPMMPGVAERRTHTYVRHGTTSLFAALDIASGFVIGKCYKRHRAQEFIDFLKQIDSRVPQGPQVHLVMDNYATHKTPKIKAWLARRPHWHVHFTPTSSSWINQVERWFAELTRKKLQRGTHLSTAELEADIHTFIEHHNANPKPYRWTKSADEILSAVKRFCQKAEKTLCAEL